MSSDRPTSKLSRSVVLDRQTLMPIGAVVAVCTMLFGGWSYLDKRLATIEELQRDQGREMRALRHELTTDRWSRTDHRIWVAELRRLNPQLPVPPVEDD